MVSNDRKLTLYIHLYYKVGAPVGSFHNDTSNAKHVYNFLHSHTHPHAHARSNTHTHIHTCWVRQHTHTAYAFSLCALKFQFLCLKVKERTKGRRKTAGNCCQSSHRNWKFLYKLQLLCYNIPFHNCLSHVPRPVLLFCAFAWRQFGCDACIIVSKWTDWLHTYTHARARTLMHSFVCVCVRVGVHGWLCVCECGINMCLLFMLVRAI